MLSLQIAFATYGHIIKFEQHSDGSGDYELEYSDDRSAVKAFEEIEKAEVSVHTRWWASGRRTLNTPAPTVSHRLRDCASSGPIRTLWYVSNASMDFLWAAADTRLTSSESVLRYSRRLADRKHQLRTCKGRKLRSFGACLRVFKLPCIASAVSLSHSGGVQPYRPLHPAAPAQQLCVISLLWPRRQAAGF